MRSSQAVTLGSPRSTAHLPRPDPARGVFETLLIVDGRPVELDAHLARLAASTRELFGAPTMARISGPARMLAEARARELAPPAAHGPASPAARPPGFARLRVELAPDDRGALDLSATTAAVGARALFPVADRGPALAALTVAGGLGAHKWADRRLLERAAADLDGAAPLIVDDDGSVLEAERANVFAVRQGIVVTPPADGRILPGVARAGVVEIARALGIGLRERPIALAEAATADEVFMTNSVRGIVPVAAIDGAAAAGAGEIARLLAAELRSRWLGSSA
jgi:para-aminobenzoate synthetase/4-amino-4-deoxychorismate lyase